MRLTDRRAMIERSRGQDRVQRREPYRRAQFRTSLRTAAPMHPYRAPTSRTKSRPKIVLELRIDHGLFGSGQRDRAPKATPIIVGQRGFDCSSMAGCSTFTIFCFPQAIENPIFSRFRDLMSDVSNAFARWLYSRRVEITNNLTLNTGLRFDQLYQFRRREPVQSARLRSSTSLSRTPAFMPDMRVISRRRCKRRRRQRISLLFNNTTQQPVIDANSPVLI